MIRLPLSAKILIWFFLNMAVLALGIIFLFNAQFRFDLNWVFASSARQRVDAVRDLIVYELNNTDPDDWDRVVTRFSNAYGLRFSLFEHDGTHLIGRISEVPPEVQARMTESAVPAPKTAANVKTAQQFPAPRVFLRTTHPTRYWLLLQVRLENPQAGGPMKVILVAEADSFSVGGLIMDPVPWLWLGVGAVIFSVLFWLPLLRGISRSISQITDSTREIAEGHFDVRVSSTRRDELGLLSEAINQMAARLNGLVKGQKRFLGDIAHELCSPLARLQMVLGIMEQRGGAGQQEHIKSAADKADQIASLVNELMTFSKASFGPSTVNLCPVDVQEAVESAILREAFGAVKIQRQIQPGLAVMSDHDLLIRALANLIRNAIVHGGETGIITVQARQEGTRVAISVADSGPGVPEADLTKIFDAFYRVDTSRARETGGTGLGLTIVKTCIDSCKGSVLARNRAPSGLEVIVRLPMAPPAPGP